MSETTVVDVLPSAVPQGEVLVVDSSNRLNGASVIPGEALTSEAAIVSSELGGIMLSTEAPDASPDAALFHTTGADVSELVPSTVDNLGVADAKDTSSDAKQQDQSDTSLVDAMLGAFVPKEAELYERAVPDDVQIAKEQAFRANLQSVLHVLSDCRATGDAEQAEQVITAQTWEDLRDGRLLRVLAAQGYADVAMLAAIKSVDDPNSSVLISEVFISTNQPLDVRIDEAALAELSITAKQQALAAVEHVGIQKLETEDKSNYFIAKVDAERNGYNGKPIHEDGTASRPLAEIEPQLSTGDKTYIASIELNYKMETSDQDSIQERTAALEATKQLYQQVNDLEASDTEGEYYSYIRDMKVSLLAHANNLDDFQLVDDMLLNHSQGYEENIKYLFPDLAEAGHVSAVLPLLERLEDARDVAYRCKSILAVSLKQDNNNDNIERTLALMRQAYDRYDQLERQYGLLPLVGESTLYLLKFGHTEQAIKLLQENPDCVINYDENHGIDNKAPSSVEVLSDLLDSSDPSSSEALVMLVSRLILNYSHDYTSGFRNLLHSHEALGNACDRVFAERMTQLLSVSNIASKRQLLTDIITFSADTERALPAEIKLQLSTELVEQVRAAHADLQLSDSEYIGIIQTIALGLSPSLENTLRYSCDRDPNSERTIARLEAIFAFGNLQEFGNALDTLPLESAQVEALVRLMGASDIYDAFAQKIISEFPDNPESLKNFLDDTARIGQHGIQYSQVSSLFLELYDTSDKSWLAYNLSQEYMVDVIKGTISLEQTITALDEITTMMRQNQLHLENAAIEQILRSHENVLESAESMRSSVQEYLPTLNDLFKDTSNSRGSSWANTLLKGDLLAYVIMSENPATSLELIKQNKESMGLLGEYVSVFMGSEVLRTELVNRLTSTDARKSFEKLHALIAENQDLINKLNDPTNVVYEFKDIFFTQLILSGEKSDIVHRLRSVFESDTMPVWSKLYTLLSLRYENAVLNDPIEYPISEIPLVKQRLGEVINPLLVPDNQVVMRNLTQMDAEDLKRYVVPMSEADLQQLVGNPVPFKSINSEYRLQVFAHYLRDAVERSVGPEFKADADVRNRSIAQPVITVNADTLLHSTDISALPKILGLGSLCGEALEVSHRRDATPLQVDLALFAGQETAEGQEAISLLSSTVQADYGNFTILFERTNGTKDSDILHRYGPHEARGQVLIPGGIAATEITGIYFKDGVEKQGSVGVDIALQTVKRQVVRNGFYIPMYDKDGSLIFSQQEYDDMKNRLANTKARQERIQTMQEAPTVSPREFIDIISDDPELEAEYAASSGVSEGYSLREHTEAIVGQFEKNFADRYQSPLLSRGAFRTMLALHDIGKAQGVALTGTTAAQHAYTVKIVEQKAATLGINDSEAIIMTEILGHDYLGDFVKGVTSAESTADQIQTIASSLGAQASDVLDLIEMYYICDASSYTDDASYSNNSGTEQIKTIPSINFVFDFSGDRIQLSDRNRALMKQLRDLL